MWIARRAEGPNQQLSMVGTQPAQTYTDDPRRIDWAGGTPTASGSDDRSGFFVLGNGNGFTLTAPADAVLRTLILHVGGYQTAGTVLTAHLSDGSAGDFTETTDTSISNLVATTR